MITGPGESGSVVVAGTAELVNGESAPVPVARGMVLQNEPDSCYTLQAGDDGVALLTCYG